MNKIKVLVKESISLALISSLVLITSFSYLEPSILDAVNIGDQHTVKQTVTTEITFVAAPADVTMSPSLPGISGGTADGQSQFRIVTGNSTGFTVTLTASSSVGMLGENISGTILHLSPTTPGVPNYTFTSAPANSSAFAYTINASTTGEITQPFRNNGSACNTGATETDANCWLNATTTAYTIINRSTSTQSSGATSTIFYRAIISANPQPLIPSGVYTATTTLTATTN